MRLATIASLFLVLVLSACGTPQAGNGGHTTLPDSAAEKSAMRQAKAQKAFDLIALDAGTKQWQAASKLRLDFNDQDKFIDRLWGVRSSDAALAWNIGMTCLPREGYSIAAKENPARAEKWFARSLEAASKQGHQVLRQARYDYARALLRNNKAKLALEVIGNRSEVEPSEDRLEELYLQLIEAILKALV